MSDTRAHQALQPALQPTRSRRAQWVESTFPATVSVIDLKVPERTIDLRFDTPFIDGYRRSTDDVRVLEDRIIDMVPRDIVGESKLAYVSVNGLSPLVDFTRTHEMSLGWADLPTYMYGYEHAGTMVCVVEFDREDGDRIVHVARIVEGRYLDPQKSCGSQVIDSLSGRVDPEEFKTFYEIEDLSRCWDVTTMYRVRDVPRSTRYTSGFTVLGYYTALRHLFANNVPLAIQYMNPASLNSLRALGVFPKPVMDRELIAPLVDDQEYNKEFEAFIIDVDDYGDVMFNPNNQFSPFMESFRNVQIPHIEVTTQ